MTRFSGNRFTSEFSLEVPIVQGPMGGASGPELVAAVANVGGWVPAYRSLTCSGAIRRRRWVRYDKLAQG